MGKVFYESLLKYMTSDPAIIMVLERENAVISLRKLAGSTNPDSAEPGTIRGDYGVTTKKNIVHASDSLESAVAKTDFNSEEQKNFFRELVKK